jgi:hypothetical protein
MGARTEYVSWRNLTAGAMVTLVVSLSVHAVMLQGLHVAYPYSFPKAGLARLPDGILSVLGAFYFSAHLPRDIRDRSDGVRCALLFLLLATIHESLFRGAFMEFINLSNFTLYPFLDNVPKLIPYAIIAIGVESWTRRKRSLFAHLVAAVLLAAIAILVIRPFANYVFAGVIHFTEAREGNQRYGLPYDWHILLPAYLTFLEPVVAALVIGHTIRPKLPPKPITRFFITAALILALKGPVFAPLLNIFYANTSAFAAVLSYAQFTFETMALGFLTAATLGLSFHAAEGIQDPEPLGEGTRVAKD